MCVVADRSALRSLTHKEWRTCENSRDPYMYVAFDKFED